MHGCELWVLLHNTVLGRGEARSGINNGPLFETAHTFFGVTRTMGQGECTIFILRIRAPAFRLCKTTTVKVIDQPGTPAAVTADCAFWEIGPLLLPLLLCNWEWAPIGGAGPSGPLPNNLGNLTGIFIAWRFTNIWQMRCPQQSRQRIFIVLDTLKFYLNLPAISGPSISCISSVSLNLT